MEVTAMSITRSYNRHTNTYYAYDTTYEWDEKAQKKVQRRRCIGKYDPDTGEIIPTERRGRPAKYIETEPVENTAESPALQYREILSKAKALASRINYIEDMINNVSEDVRNLRQSIDALVAQIEAED